MMPLVENIMGLKLQTLWPEIVLTIAAFTVMIVGLSPTVAARRSTYGITMAALLLAAIIAAAGPALGFTHVPEMALYIKIATCLIGLLLVACAAEVPDEDAVPEAESSSRTFDPANTSRGEFFGLILLSLVGLMLCAGADDLIWLFLALELTSLPTYVLVATSRQSLQAPEAAVKYFFLGAMSAAIFLYGFALIYGGTGTTMLPEIQAAIIANGMNPLTTAGVLLAIVGICFKIAAVPMHLYVADVYQGAATPVAAFLAFVPKAAGFVSLIIILGAVGWPLETRSETLVALLWILAVLTMFVGNTLALVQNNVKRVLAYSSVAHSGYMLVGLAVGPGVLGGDTFMTRNGVAAVLFYLVSYGVMNLGAFAVLGMLKRAGEEAQTFDDLKGLAYRRPGLAAVMAICVLSLTGIPPLVGFWAKLLILGSAISAGYYVLAALIVINSAIAAFYYLRIVSACFLYDADERVAIPNLPSRSFSAVASAVVVVLMSLIAAPLLTASLTAADEFKPLPPTRPPVQAQPDAEPATPANIDVAKTQDQGRRAEGIGPRA